MDANNTSLTPRISFVTGDTRLDLIALKIIWEKDPGLWQSVTREYPALCSVEEWNGRAIRRVVRMIYVQKRKEISQAAKNFIIWWRPVEIGWFNLLDSLFTPKNKIAAVYTCYIGISPISPRIIEKGSYSASYLLGKEKSRLLHAHETSHFYFYRKIQELGLEHTTGSRRFWLLSEAMAPLILNDPAVMKITGSPAPGSYVCKESLVEKCRPHYDKLRSREIGINEFFTLLIGIKINREDLNLKFT